MLERDGYSVALASRAVVHNLVGVKDSFEILMKVMHVCVHPHTHSSFAKYFRGNDPIKAYAYRLRPPHLENLCTEHSAS